VDFIIIIVIGAVILMVIERVSCFFSGKDYYDSGTAKLLGDEKPKAKPELLQHVAVLQNTPSMRLNTDDVFTIMTIVGTRPDTAVNELNKQEITNNYKTFILVESKDAASFEQYLASYLSQYKAPKRSCGRQLYKCSNNDMISAVNSSLMCGHNWVVSTSHPSPPS